MGVQKPSKTPILVQQDGTTTNIRVNKIKFSGATVTHGVGDTANVAISSGISFDGSTSNGVLTYKDADETTVESKLTFDGSSLIVDGTMSGSGNISGSSFYATKDVYADQLRRSSSNSTTTKINLDASAQKFYVGHASNEVIKIESNTVTISPTAPVLRMDADTDNFAKLEWAENGTRKWAIYHDHADDNLTFKQGTVDSGTDLMVITQEGGIGVGTTTPKPGLTVINDYQSTAFESVLSDGEYNGEVLRYSPGADDTLTAGQIYFLHTDGTWDSADADDVDDGASQLLGVGLGGSSRTVGVLIKGFIRIPSTEILNLPGSGACDGLPLYISTTAGHFDFTAPSGNNDFVRIVGYAIDDDSSDVLVYFNPDHTWVKVTA